MINWWKSYWFNPAPLIDLAIVRITAVSCQLLWVHAGRLSGLSKTSELPDGMYNPLPILHLLIWPFGWEYRPSLDELSMLWWITLLTGVFSLIGLISNLSLAIFAIGSLFLQAYVYSFGELHHPEAVMMITLAVLALSPAGKCLSVDSMFRRKLFSKPALNTPLRNLLYEESIYAGWPIRLIQWIFVLMYLSAFLSKMSTSGLDWINGYTLQYYLLQDGLRWDSPLAIWFAQHHTLVFFTQWIIIIFQLTFALAVIFPPLRWIYVPLGLSMHLGILFTLKAPFIQWIVLYVVFVPWTRLFKRLSRKVSYRSKVRA